MSPLPRHSACDTEWLLAEQRPTKLRISLPGGGCSLLSFLVVLTGLCDLLAEESARFLAAAVPGMSIP